jgi:hypothetical protein
MLKRYPLLLAGLVGLLGPAAGFYAAAPAGPAYQIVLRSRRAEVTPNRSKDAQTGGGAIVVDQPEPNTIVVTMGGSAVVGSDCHCSAAGLDFHLEQDLDVIPIRQGLRRPRVGMVGRVVGTLQVTAPGLCCKPCGSADQGPAVASLAMGESSLLSLNVPPAAASCAQELAINHREGPIEAPAVAGPYHLTALFHIGVNQGKGLWNRRAAVADFDPAPQLDAFWADALKPFRAVPRRDFGFQLIVRAVEDAGG